MPELHDGKAPSPGMEERRREGDLETLKNGGGTIALAARSLRDSSYLDRRDLRSLESPCRALAFLATVPHQGSFSAPRGIFRMLSWPGRARPCRSAPASTRAPPPHGWGRRQSGDVRRWPACSGRAPIGSAAQVPPREAF